MKKIYWQLVVLSLLGMLLAGVCWGGSVASDFGTMKMLKSYPEYKRGYDPYANLSGLLQENVDPYSGKLNLIFPLPTIPWSATKSFGPVLIYNSNVWARQVDTALQVGGSLPGELPAEQEILTPAYWTNDAFVRFSPIGKPHAMPGWTLTVGGVYTEYYSDLGNGDDWAMTCFGAGHNSENPVQKLWATVKKKYFVAPDGSTHLLVDTATNCLPYLCENHTGFDSTPENMNEACETYCNTTGMVEHKCLPHLGVDDPRIWRAVDGSGYYYVEAENKVYGRDGTSYQLDGTGRIDSIRDTDGNAIQVSVSINGDTMSVVYQNQLGGGKITVVFSRLALTHWRPAGGGTDPISCWLLDRVEGPTVGQPTGFVIKFESHDLLDNLGRSTDLKWQDLFVGDDLSDPFREWIFTSRQAPAGCDPNVPQSGYNRQIKVLDDIELPDGRHYRFKYNVAGKIKTITYPDGGKRTYLYGNTPTRSHYEQTARYRRGQISGESPLGGVSLVYQGSPESGMVLERAYAYNQPKESPQMGVESDELKTLVWKADRSAEIYSYYAEPSISCGLRDFGFPGYRNGKTHWVRAYDFSGAAGPDAATIQKLLCINDNMNYPEENFNEILAGLVISLENDWLREERYTYKNAHDFWNWSFSNLPYCQNSICNGTWSSLGAYGNLPPAEELYPECNSWMDTKTLKVRPPGGGESSILTKIYTYSMADQGSERYAVKEWEAETDWNSADVAIKKEYTYCYYWQDGSAANMPHRVLGIPLAERVLDGDNPVAATENVYRLGNCQFENPVDLHPQYTRKWIAAGRWAKTGYTYSTTYPLRLIKTSDYADETTRVNQTAFEYNPTDNPVRLLTKASVANCPDENCGAIVQYMKVKCDPYTGLLLSRTDRNGAEHGDSIEFGYDSCLRPQQVYLQHTPQGGGQPKQILLTDYTYSAAADLYKVRKREYLNIGETANEPTVWKESVVENDEFGRPTKSAVSLGKGRNNQHQWALSWKEYDLLGRPVKEFGPAKLETSALDGMTALDWMGLSAPWTTIARDALGREIARSRYDANGTEHSTTHQSHGFATITVGAAPYRYTTEQVTDENGRWRKLYKDGLERVRYVFEPNPSGGSTLQTDYTYNVLGNLTGVNKRDMNGNEGQVRTFTYDGLGRLTAAVMPEFANDNTFHYTYDDQGNLTRKQLENSSSTVLYEEDMSYDGLGRLQSRSVQHEGRTITTTNHYDETSGGYRWGKLTSDAVHYPDGVEINRSFVYEWHGQIEHKNDFFSGVPDESLPLFSTEYTYDDAGALKSVRYPSGLVVENSMSAGGGLWSIKAQGQNVFDQITCAASGAPAEMKYSLNNLTVEGLREYDPTTMRLTACTVGPNPGGNIMALFQLSYTYENNGNVLTMNRGWRESLASGDLSWMQGSYSYDSLNRLKTFQFKDPQVTGNSWANYQYNMDVFGNLLAETKSGAGGGPAGRTMAVNASTNRLNSVAYDVLGNQKSISGPDEVPMTLSYWDQGHVYQAVNSTSGTAYRYYYDADGKRRVKVMLECVEGVSLGTSCAFYEGEDLVAERDFRQLIQDDEAYQEKFLLTDHLGTTRAELTALGGQMKIRQVYDTMPYGQLISPTAVQKEQVIYTGKQRDTETGMDCFNARNYSSSLGRWPSPDPYLASAKIGKPQNWNRYSYCANNPVNFVDTKGLDYCDLTATQKRLVNDWAQTQNEMAGTDICPATMYNNLKVSQKATYEAILNALENTKILCKDKRQYRAIDAVQSIETIMGKDRGKPGEQQFRIYVSLKNGASDDILSAKNFTDTFTHSGFANSRQQKVDAPSLQFCFSRNGNIADIDIDYESKGFPQVTWNGHLNPENSDPRAGNHYEMHEERFFLYTKLGAYYDPDAD